MRIAIILVLFSFTLLNVSSYSVNYSDDHSVIGRLKEFFEQNLELLKSRAFEYKKVYELVKEKIQDIKHRITDLRSLSGQKLIDAVSFIRSAFVELTKDILDGIKDASEEEKQEIIGQKLTKFLSASLKLLKERAQTYKGVYESVKEKIHQIEDTMKTLAKKTGSNLSLAARLLKDSLIELHKSIQTKIDETTSEDEQEKTGRELLDQIQLDLNALKYRLQSHPKTYEEYKNKLDTAQKKLDNIRDHRIGSHLFYSAQILQDEIIGLKVEIEHDLDLVGNYNGFNDAGLRLLDLLQKELNVLRESAQKYDQVYEKFGTKLDEVQERINQVRQLPNERIFTEAKLIRDISLMLLTLDIKRENRQIDSEAIEEISGKKLTHVLEIYFKFLQSRNHEFKDMNYLELKLIELKEISGSKLHAAARALDTVFQKIDQGSHDLNPLTENERDLEKSLCLELIEYMKINTQGLRAQIAAYKSVYPLYYERLDHVKSSLERIPNDTWGTLYERVFMQHNGLAALAYEIREKIKRAFD